MIEFEIAAERGVPGGRPGEEISVADLQLATDLIQEEWKETDAAMLVGLIGLAKSGRIDDEALAEIADGLADLAWVCLAAAVRLGVDLPAVWQEVKKSNMSKFDGGVLRRADGKIIKGPNFIPPDIAGVLSAQKPLSKTYGVKE